MNRPEMPPHTASYLTYPPCLFNDLISNKFIFYPPHVVPYMYTPPCRNNLVIEYTPPDPKMGTHIQHDTKSDIHHSQQSTQHQAAKPVIPKVIIGQNKYPLKSPTQTLKRRNRSSGRPHQQHQSTRNPQLFSPPLPKKQTKKGLRLPPKRRMPPIQILHLLHSQPLQLAIHIPLLLPPIIPQHPPQQRNRHQKHGRRRRQIQPVPNMIVGRIKRQETPGG